MADNRDLELRTNPPKSFFSEIVSTFRSKVTTFGNKEFYLNITSVFLLTIIGVLIRFLSAYYFRVHFPEDASITNIWDRAVIFNPNEYTFFGFDDFSYYYENWTKAWYEENWYPYIWGNRHDSPLLNYSYPPFFLYIIALFWRPGMSNLWIAFPLVVSDSICAGIVFLILRHFFKGEDSLALSIFGGILFVLAPLNIIYVGTYWLNTGPVTLFTLIVVFLCLKQKWWQAFMWLAIATLAKQNALFLIYPLFFFMLGKKLSTTPLKKALLESCANGFLYLFILLVGSFPFIIQTPKYYILHNAVPGEMLALNTNILETDVKCIDFAYALKQLGIGGFILDFFAFGINSMLLFYIAVTLITTILFWRSFKNKLTDIGFIELISSYILLSHLFLPRGMFKFYTPYFTPFYLMALFISFKMMLKKENQIIVVLVPIVLIFLGSNVWILFIFRKLFPLIIALILVLIWCSSLLRNYLFNKSSNFSRGKQYFEQRKLLKKVVCK